MPRRKTSTKSFKKREKRDLKNGTKKIWSCPEGCDLTKGVPCKHLEAELIEPRDEPRFESTHSYAGSNPDAAYYESGAGYVIPEGIKNRSYEYQFRTKLEKAGLEPVTVDILVLKYIYDMTFKEISEELGIISITSSMRLHNSALVKLRKAKLK